MLFELLAHLTFCSYYLRIEPQRIVFDIWPRAGDTPYITGLERSMLLTGGRKYNIEIFVEETIGIIYINDEVAMNVRMYDLKEGQWGVFAMDALASFTDIRLYTC